MAKKKPFSIAFDLPFDEAIAAARARKVELPEPYYRDLPIERRSQSFTVSGLAAVDQVQGVLDKLTAHLAEGGTLGSFQTWATSQSFGLPRHRLETIYRNAVQTAYNAGHWRRFEENKDARPYLMYDAINDSRTRPAHRAMDGIIRPVDDPFWLTHAPPNGHRCRCRLLSLTGEEAEIRSRDGRGLNQPVTPEMRADDAGWGRKPTQWSESLQALISNKANECLAFDFAGKRTAPPIWCHGAGAEYLRRLSAALGESGAFEPPSAWQITEFADRARDATNVQEIVLLGPAENARQIAGATGLVLVTYARALDNFGIKHTFNKHGDPNKEEARGQRAITATDFALIPLIVSSPDEIAYVGKSKHSRADLIQYKKTINGEVYFYIEEVRRKRRIVALETLYVRKR